MAPSSHGAGEVDEHFVDVDDTDASELDEAAERVDVVEDVEDCFCMGGCPK